MNPAYYILLILGVLPYLILRLFLRKAVGLLVPLCERHYRISSNLRLTGVILIVVGLLGGIALIASLGDPDRVMWGLLLGALLILIGFIFEWAQAAQT